MVESVFFRVLNIPIHDKSRMLATQIEESNIAGDCNETFVINPNDFSKIPGSPFAYWVTPSIAKIYATHLPTESQGRAIRVSNETGDDFRFMRLWTEVTPQRIGREKHWVPHAKGGPFNEYYYDLHLLVAWDDERGTIRDYYGRPSRPDHRMASTDFFFRPGLTYPRRTNRFSIRTMPMGCVFSNKGVGFFVPYDNEIELLSSLAILSSSLYLALLYLQIGAGMLARSFEVGAIQNVPFPYLSTSATNKLANLARRLFEIQRNPDKNDEFTHAFHLPGIIQYQKNSLLEIGVTLDNDEQMRREQLNKFQGETYDMVFDLYELDASDRAFVDAEIGGIDRADSALGEAPDDGDDDEPTSPEDLSAHVHNLLMWCVGVAFGRWDARMALDPSLLPALQGPFDPLPRCAPGALIGTNGLPPATAADIASEAWLRARQSVLDIPPVSQVGDQTSLVEYPLPVAWDGILVDDENHPADIVGHVEQVIRLLWGSRSDAIMQEACEILGVPNLRSYFRDPRQGFYAFHIKRYSKSRRKAPIYWLLQSEKRNYSIWLYYHRMSDTTLFEAARRPYTDAKVMLEEARLGELQQSIDALSGAALKQREREIERQQKLVAEVTAFRDLLDKVALLQLPPDHNDGVIISVAPLHALTPWKEAEKMWHQLVAGEYSWSTMSQQMRKRGLVKS